MRTFSTLRQILLKATKLNRAAGGVASITNALASTDNLKYLTLNKTTGQLIDENDKIVPVARIASVTLTAAQVKALAATPQTLVAAPGAGYFLEFVAAYLIHDYATAAFTEAGDYNMAIRYTDGSGVIVSQSIDANNFLVGVSADTITNAQPKIDAVAAASGQVNKALVLDNTGAGEYAGSAAGTVTVKTLYRVWASGL